MVRMNAIFSFFRLSISRLRFRFASTLALAFSLAFGVFSPSLVCASENLLDSSFTLSPSYFSMGKTSYTAGTKGNITTIITKIVRMLFSILAMVAVFSIIVAGYLMIFAGGDPGKAGQAKNIVTYNALAIALALSAYLIIEFVSWIVTTVS